MTWRKRCQSRKISLKVPLIMPPLTKRSPVTKKNNQLWKKSVSTAPHIGGLQGEEPPGSDKICCRTC